MRGERQKAKGKRSKEKIYRCASGGGERGGGERGGGERNNKYTEDRSQESGGERLASPKAAGCYKIAPQLQLKLNLTLVDVLALTHRVLRADPRHSDS